MSETKTLKCVKSSRLILGTSLTLLISFPVQLPMSIQFIFISALCSQIALMFRKSLKMDKMTILRAKVLIYFVTRIFTHFPILISSFCFRHYLLIHNNNNSEFDTKNTTKKLWIYGNTENV